MSSAQKAAQVIHGIQGFTRMKPGEGYELVDVNEIVEQSIELSRPKWKDEPEQRGSEVWIEREYGEISEVEGNAGELCDVVNNLLFNAVDAMPEGGRSGYVRRSGRDMCIWKYRTPG